MATLNFPKVSAWVLAISILVGLSSSSLLAQEPAPETSAPNKHAVADLRYGAALYDYYLDDYLSALNQLHVADAQGGIKGHGDNPQLTEAGISLAYGMETHAQNVFKRILDANRPLDVRNAAWFYLARLQYSRGHWARSQQSLDAIAEPIDDEIGGDVLALRINLSIRLEQLDEALALLATLPEDSSWQNYLNFNVGAAYSRLGEYETSIRYYDAVRDLPVPESLKNQSEHLALYDKALTAAGYSLMLSEQPVEAIKRFIEVRRDSPWSSRALLGYGWSALESKNYRLALQPWQALVEGPIALASTQEAMMALPYVYEQLDASGEALAEWQQAEARFSTQLERLEQTQKDLASLSLIEAFQLNTENRDSHWLAPAQTYPVPDALNTLEEVLSSNTVREKMQLLRDLSRLDLKLVHWQEKIQLYKVMVDERHARRREQSSALEAKNLEDQERSLTLARNKFKNELVNIESDKDYLSLAFGETRELNEIVERLGQSLAILAAEGEDMSFEQEAYERYRGILLWQASEAYSDQLWQAKQRLKTLDLALEELKARRKSIAQVLADAPDIQPWHKRLDKTSLRIVEHHSTVKQALTETEDALRQELQQSLSVQRQHLLSYLAQTRLAVARLLDAALRSQSQ